MRAGLHHGSRLSLYIKEARKIDINIDFTGRFYINFFTVLP